MCNEEVKFSKKWARRKVTFKWFFNTCTKDDNNNYYCNVLTSGL